MNVIRPLMTHNFYKQSQKILQIGVNKKYSTDKSVIKDIFNDCTYNNEKQNVNNGEFHKPFSCDKISPCLGGADPAGQKNQNYIAKIQNEALEYLVRALPVGMDLNDPVDQSNIALKKLKRNFETLDISHEDRSKFVRSLYKDLKGDLSRPAFVHKLFHNLEPRSWPLVFLYFDSDVCTDHFSAYYEEKTLCGTFKKTNKSEPPKLEETTLDNKWKEVADQKLKKLESGETSVTPMSVADLQLWQKMGKLTHVFKENRECGFFDQNSFIDIASQTLLNMVENPLISDRNEAAWAMQHLYQVSCETNLIHKVMQHFIEICPPKKFIPIVKQFAHAAFFYNKKALTCLIAESLEDAHIDKSEFIADCLIAAHESDETYYDFDFWKEPLTRTHQERAQVAKHIIRKMQFQFLSLYLSYNFGKREMIESLFATDPTSAEEFFHEGLNNLIKANNEPAIKFIIFQNLADAFINAGFNVAEQMTQDEKEQVTKWYSSEIISEHLSCNRVGWKLLFTFRQELCLPMALRKIQSIFSESYLSVYDLNNLLVNFEQLDLLEDLKDQVFKNKKLLELIKNVSTHEIPSFFRYSDDKHALLLIQAIVPDWKKHLADWSRDYIKKQKAESLSYGSKPQYYELEPILKTLQKLSLYDHFTQELVKDLNIDLQHELDRVFARE